MKEDKCLLEIEKLLQLNSKSLSDFPPMPMPTEAPLYDVAEQIIFHELNFNREENAIQAEQMKAQLTSQQLKVYDSIISSVSSNSGGFFFVCGYGGTGKTFLWNILTFKMCSEGKIVINVASSSIAATLLPSGRTTHSRFGIPIDINEDSTCNIYHNSSLAKLLQLVSLIIWDETPMTQRLCFEDFDRTLRDLMKCNLNLGENVLL